MKRILLLGSTGSVGRSALDVVASQPRLFQIEGLAAHTRWQDVAEQARRFRPRVCAMVDPSAAEELRHALSGSPTKVIQGHEGLREMVADSKADVVLCAIAGAAGLIPSVEALRSKKPLALANKESLVIGGEILTRLARENDVPILPVDSEHSGIFQALRCGRRSEIRRVILTASGGPFLDAPLEALASVTPAEALRHPTWSMGPRITVDSATLMNKAMEVVEARWLFDLPVSQIEVWIHPQSIVHSLVEFIDGSVIAQMGVPDMRIPIQFALSYPDRSPCAARQLAIPDLARLTFATPDPLKFPCLELGYRAARAAGVAASVMNAADEIVVSQFLSGRISFNRIAEVVATVLESHLRRAPAANGAPTTDEILGADAWARREADRCCSSQ